MNRNIHFNNMSLKVSNVNEIYLHRCWRSRLECVRLACRKLNVRIPVATDLGHNNTCI